MYSRTDGMAVVVAVVAHAMLAAALASGHVAVPRRSDTIDIDIVAHPPVEKSDGRHPTPAVAAPPQATATPVKVDRPKTIPTVVPKQEVVEDKSGEAVEAPRIATVSSAPATGGADGGVAGGMAGGIAGGTAGGQKGGAADGRAGGDALVGPSYGADYLRNVPPRYPAAARRMNMEGTTTLRVLVSAEGRPTNVRVHTSSGVDALDEAALEAVQHWSFVPARQGSTPVAAEVNVPVRFRLDAASAE